jgi:hypothetical protein
MQFIRNLTPASLSSVAAPWRRGIRWWVLVIEGIIVAALGAILLLDTANAIGWVLVVTSAVLLAESILIVSENLRAGAVERSQMMSLVRSGGALVAAIVVLIGVIFRMDRATTAAVMGGALIVTGAIELMRVLFMRPAGTSLAPSGLVEGLVRLLLGVLVFVMISTPDVIGVSGGLLIAAGIGLIAWGIIKWQSARRRVVVQDDTPPLE